MLRAARLLQNTKRQKEDHRSFHCRTLKFLVLTCKPIADTKECPGSGWLPSPAAGTMLEKKDYHCCSNHYGSTPLNAHRRRWMQRSSKHRCQQRPSQVRTLISQASGPVPVKPTTPASPELSWPEQRQRWSHGGDDQAPRPPARRCRAPHQQRECNPIEYRRAAEAGRTGGRA